MRGHSTILHGRRRALLVTGPSEVARAVDWIATKVGVNPIAIDFETTGLYPANGAQPRVLSIDAGPALLDGCVIVFDLWRTGTPSDVFARLFAGRPIIAHNAQFEALWAGVLGWTSRDTQWICTKLAFGLWAPTTKLDDLRDPDDLDEQNDLPARRGGAALANAMQMLFDIELLKDLQGPENWADPVPLDEAQINYAATDAVAAWMIWDRIEDDISRHGLTVAFEVACSAIPAAAEIELYGMPVDQDALLEVIAGWRAEHRKAYSELNKLEDFPRKRMTDDERVAAELDKVIDAETGRPSNPERLLINGPAVARWIEERISDEDLSDWPLTDSGDRIKTGAKILRRYAKYAELQPLIRAMEMAKYLSTYGKSLLEKLNEDGRLRSSLTLCAAKTGRSASSKPNAQNYPRQGFKHIFKPDPGRVFVRADLGSIELRAVACIAEDEDMLNAFEDPDLDLHKLTASEALGVPFEDVTKSQRSTGKAANFLALYGGRGAALRTRLIEDRVLAGEAIDDVPSEGECQAFIDAFWSRWSGVAEWRDQLIDDLREETRNGLAAVVTTPLGRLVPVPPSKKQFERAEETGRQRPLYNYTLACNAPVQGGAAECAMAILAKLFKHLSAIPDATIVAFVHDEFVIECDFDDAEQVEEVLTSAMIDGCLSVFPRMPIKGLVDAEIVERWAEPSEDNRRLPKPSKNLRRVPQNQQNSTDRTGVQDEVD